MILFKSRQAIERDAIAQLLAGMRVACPWLAAQWFAEIECTQEWVTLGQRIANAIVMHQPSALVSASPSIIAIPSSASADESRSQELQTQVWRAQAETRREGERAAQAENDARRWQTELVKANQRAAERIAQLEHELADLRRIVGEQQYQINQMNAPTE